MGTGVPFLGVKRQGRQVVLSPSVPWLKMNGAIPLLPVYASMARKATGTLFYLYFPSMPWSSNLPLQVYRLSLYVFLIPYALHTPSISYLFIRLFNDSGSDAWVHTVNEDSE